MPGLARAEKRQEKGEHTKRSEIYNSPAEANQQYRVWMCKTNEKWQAQGQHAKKRPQKIKRPWQSRARAAWKAMLFGKQQADQRRADQWKHLCGCAYIQLYFDMPIYNICLHINPVHREKHSTSYYCKILFLYCRKRTPSHHDMQHLLSFLRNRCVPAMHHAIYRQHGTRMGLSTTHRE